MKQYLNKAERQLALSLSAFETRIEEKVGEMAQHNGDKELLKNMRYAKTYLHKALESMLQPLDPTELNVLLRDISKMEVVVKYKDQAIREYNAMLKLNSVTPVETEDLLDIVEQAVNICVRCDRTDADKCRLRELFLKYDIEPLDKDAPGGKCPYKYN